MLKQRLEEKEKSRDNGSDVSESMAPVAPALGRANVTNTRAEQILLVKQLTEPYLVIVLTGVLLCVFWKFANEFLLT